MAKRKSVGAVAVSQDKEWEARNDADTLRRAEEIKADRKRHSRAAEHARREAHHLMAVAAKASSGERAKKRSPSVAERLRREKL